MEYWQELAEQRRIALLETLQENEQVCYQSGLCTVLYSHVPVCVLNKVLLKVQASYIYSRIKYYRN